MSRRTSSGSRFQPLADYKDSDSDSAVSRRTKSADSDTSGSSATSMRLSRDFYPTIVPEAPAQTSPGRMSPSRTQSAVSDASGASSARSMRLSRDLYPITLPEVPAQSSTQRKTRSSPHTSDSSATSTEEMTLSRDFYQTDIPGIQQIGGSGGASLQAPPTQGPRITIMRQPNEATPGRFHVLKRSKPEVPTAQEVSHVFDLLTPTGAINQPVSDIRALLRERLRFDWDHYSETDPYADVKSPSSLFEGASATPEQLLPQTIAEDIPILRETGFDIDFPDGKLGEGYFGAVFRGQYGTGAIPVTDNPSLFAVKVCDFGTETNRQDAIDKRLVFETEKYILTNVYHKNVVPIRMVINMGELKALPFSMDAPNITFLSPQRVYMIMDLAQLGELDSWLNKNSANLQPYERIEFIRGLFFGLLYLHQMDILHGDIHSGNILLFEEDGEKVAKWTDFGLGFVGNDRQYRYKKTPATDVQALITRDIYGMASVFLAIMNNRLIRETPEEKQLLEELKGMTKSIRKDKFYTLQQVLDAYRPTLEVELFLVEEHFQ